MKRHIKNFIHFLMVQIQIIIVFLAFNLTPRKDKKIIIGVSEIANILFNFKSIFKDKCITVCKNGNPFYKKNDYDITFSDFKKLKKALLSAYYFGCLAKNSHLFIYLWTDGFLLNRDLDFKFLKKHNIPIACNFLGDDIRSRKLFREYCESINFNTYVDYNQPEIFLSDNYDKQKMQLARQADKYATIIFSHKTDQLSYLKTKQYFFPPLIDNNILRYNIDKFKSVSTLRILHAPSSPSSKGTPIVRSAIKQLKKEGYNFDYIEVINKPHEEVIRELSLSHIVLNQFYAFIPGIFGLEAMATCNAVLMSAKPDQFPYSFNNAWIETEDWQLYTNLKALLDNPDTMIKYAVNGFNYIKDNFSYNNIIDHLTKVFSQFGLKLDI